MRIPVILTAIVACVIVISLVWIGMQTTKLERKMCLKQPDKAWSKGACIDR